MVTAILSQGLDAEDRNGVRATLIECYLRSGRPRRALQLCEKFSDYLGADGYLHALSQLLVAGADTARPILKRCLSYYPQVARFILDRQAAPPPNDAGMGGVIVGSEYEGWLSALTWGSLWWQSDDAIALLRNEAAPFAAKGWKRFSG